MISNFVSPIRPSPVFAELAVHAGFTDPLSDPLPCLLPLGVDPPSNDSWSGHLRSGDPASTSSPWPSTWLILCQLLGVLLCLWHVSTTCIIPKIIY